MSDVLKAQIAGCRAIVVSHHHGRLPFGIPPVSILPELLQSGIKGTEAKLQKMQEQLFRNDAVHRGNGYEVI